MRSTKYARSLLALAIAGTPMAFSADEETSAFLEEVIVTAQKRSESLQDVPNALSAFTGDFIKEANHTHIKKLVAYTPGLAGLSTDSFLDSLSVRGVSTNSFGIGGDSSIGIYKDGVYYGRNGAAVTSFFDIERVEILKGPQGLLFGRNAASGAIHTITEKPKLEEVEGYVRLGAGENDRLQGEFAYNQPLGDTWAMRIAGVHSEEDGFVKNVYNGDDLGAHDRDAIRFSIRKEADWGDVTLTAEHEDREQYGSIYIGADANGNSITGDDRKANLDFQGKDDAKVTGVTLTANIDLNDKMSLTSITGYVKHEWVYQEDWDGTPSDAAGYVQDQDGEYYSQELRLNVETSEDLSWYVGASAYKEDVTAKLSNATGDTTPYFTAAYTEYFTEYFDDAYLGAYYGAYYGGVAGAYTSDILETNSTDGEYSGWAVYADMTYQLTEKMDVSLGARYTYDEKEATTNIQGGGFVWPVITPTSVKSKADWDDVSPRINLRYFLDNDTMLFGSVTSGYKAGGFGTDNVTSFAPVSPWVSVALPDAELDDFDPETILSYEVGAKGDLAGGRVKYGVSAYYYNYEDLQTVIIEVGKALVENIGEVDGVGVELDLRAAINDNWDVFLGGAWSDTDTGDIPLDVCAEPSGSDCNGNRLPFNPEWMVSGGINAHYPLNSGEVFAGLDFSWQDEFYSTLENTDGDAVDSVGFVNLRTGWNSEQNWSVSVYVENVFDEESFAARDTGFFAVNVAPTRPRIAGVDISYTF
jgi:iron complex outermembrane receptor protein